MTFEQLDFFIAVVENKTFLDAAETLHISQSALSKQIMKLEKELDILLLSRSRRSASLTAAGELFYKDALMLREQYRHVLLRLDAFRESTVTQLHIGTLPILTQYRLTPLLKQFSEEFPNIKINIDEVEETDLIKGLSCARYDLIIARPNILNQSHSTYLITEDELIAALPADHPLAEKPSVRLEDIANEPFILMNRYTSIFRLCMEIFRQSGIHVNLIRTARVESIIGAVAIHEGISLLAKSNFQVFHHENVVTVPLTPSIRLPVVFGKKKSVPSGGALTKFISFIRQNQP